MITKIPIKIDDEVITALVNLAREEYRDVPQQAAVLIRDGLIQRGLLLEQEYRFSPDISQSAENVAA